MNLPGGWELILVCLVIMVLFGAKRLPEASRSLGRSMRIFKAETKGLRDDDTTTVQDATYVPTPVAPPAPVHQAPVPQAPAYQAPVYQDPTVTPAPQQPAGQQAFPQATAPQPTVQPYQP